MRTANFTSSSIHRLTGFDRSGKEIGKPFFEYVKEKRWEKLLGKPLQNETSSRETSWGDLVELMAFSKMPIEYKLQSDKRYKHPTLPYSGAPDMLTDTIVCDIKCPFSLKSFCEMVEIKEPEQLKKQKPEYYWQLVSNGILADRDIAEFVVYAPYQEDLNVIREMIQNYDGDQNKFAWMNWAYDEQLPYLIKGGHYKDLNIFRFEIPQQDKDFLLERIIKASELL